LLFPVARSLRDSRHETCVKNRLKDGPDPHGQKLNRGMGLPGGYPFVLSPPAVEKLKFVHETLNAGTT